MDINVKNDLYVFFFSGLPYTLLLPAVRAASNKETAIDDVAN